MASAQFNDFCSARAQVIDELVNQFADYEPTGGFDRPRFFRWLMRFQTQHLGMALKFAEAVQYYGTHRISGLMPALRSLIETQIAQEGVQQNSVFYVPLGRTAESGQDIVRKYRNVNKLHGLKKQFIQPNDLPEAIHGSGEPAIFFLDDFIGTGKQVCDQWRDLLSQLVYDFWPLYVAVLAAFPDGMKRIEDETPLRVLPVHTLSSRNQLLESGNRALTSHDKQTLLRYCQQVGNHPLGHGDIGALVSFAHGTPNNSASIIRGSAGQRDWPGLLPGWEDLH